MAEKRRIAVVHDFLYCYGGAERVLEQILRAFPQADVFSLFDFVPESERGFLRGKTVTSTFLQKMPFARSRHRAYLPLMPLAIEQLDLSAYDIVISSSYAVAKGVLTRPDQLHVCYCHTPIRFAWDMQHQYLRESGLCTGVKSMMARLLLHYIRTWDLRTSNGVDAFATNSHFVGRRIKKVYRRNAVAIYPPVDVDRFTFNDDKDDFYVTASRLVPYKKVGLIADAFRKLAPRKLVIIGDGPDWPKIKAKAAPNVLVMGHQPFDMLHDYMRRARGFVFAAEEDFGIVSVEAQACGTPVIAFGRGGATESIIEGVTGLFFKDQTVASIVDAVRRFEATPAWDYRRIRQNAECFSAGRFRRQFAGLVEAEWVVLQEAQLRGRTQARAASLAASPKPVAGSESVEDYDVEVEDLQPA